MKKIYFFAALVGMGLLAACGEVPEERKVWSPEQVSYMLAKGGETAWQLTSRIKNNEAVSLQACGDVKQLTFKQDSFFLERIPVDCELLTESLIWKGKWKVLQDNPKVESDSMVFNAVNGSQTATLNYTIESVTPYELAVSFWEQKEGTSGNVRVKESYVVMEE